MQKEKIKICYVANADAFVKFLLLPQLKFLVKERYDVHVVCSGGKWVGDIEKEGIKVKVIKIKRKITPFYDLITLYRMWSYFKKEKFDIVHTNNPKPGLLGQLAAKMVGVPIILNTVHGLYFQNNSSFLKRKFFIIIEKIAARCSSLIFFVNKEDMCTAVKEGICNKDLIKYLGGGINTNKFDSRLFNHSFINKKKNELGIKLGGKVIGIVARLVKEKGYLDLFEASKIVLKDFPKMTLLVIGPKEPEKKDGIDPEIVKNYGIEKNVIFLGEREDTDQIYPVMDIFALPSYREGLGVAILEAMSEMRPVVASDIRGCREEIENGKNGILIPTKNPNRLAKAIISLFNNPSRSKRLGENARLRVEKYFKEELIFDRIKKEHEIFLKNRNITKI